MHTKDILADALRSAGLDGLADKAASGYYHDYLSPTDTRFLQLADDIQEFSLSPDWPRRDEAHALLVRMFNREFLPTQAEQLVLAGKRQQQAALLRAFRVGRG